MKHADFLTLMNSGPSSPFGPELVINGNFDTNTAGWDPIGGAPVLSVDTGRMKVVSDGNPGVGANQTLSSVLEIGATYNFRGVMTLGNTADMGRLGLSSGLSGSYQVASTPNVNVNLVATGVSVAIACLIASSGAWGAAGNFAYFDSISLRKVL